MRILQIVNYAVVDKEWNTYKRKVSFGRTMIQVLELLQLVKRYVLRQSDVEQWRNQACSFSHACQKANISQ